MSGGPAAWNSGIITGSSAWRFSSIDLTRARRALRLQRDFDADPELAGLVLDLLDEIDRLRALLKRAGVEYR